MRPASKAIQASLLILGAAVAASMWHPSPAQSEGAPRLVVAVQKLPDTLEPMREFTNVGMRIVYNFAETLIEIDFKNGHALVPGLAKSWTRVDDQTIEFELRRDVSCHNGEPMTSEDVAFTFGLERFRGEDAPGKSIGSVLLANLAEPEVLGPYKVRIRSTKPDPLLEHRMANYMSQIICKDAYLAVNDWDKWSQMPVATGPYEVADFKAGESITLEAFDKYWGEKAPAASVRFREVPELSTRVAGLASGEFDIITEVTPDQLSSIDGQSGLETVGGPIRNVRMIVYDATNQALDDPRVRRAMNLAIDRQLIVDTIFHGRTKVPRSLQMELFGDMYLEDWPAMVHDPKAAKQLIKDSDYNGEQINFRTVGNYYTGEIDTTQAVVNMWQDIGLNARVQVVENWDQVYEDDEGRTAQNTSATAFYPDPTSQLWRLFSPDDRYQKRGFWSNQEFNRLGAILESSTDLKQRRKVFRDMLEIYEQDPPGTVLYALPMLYGKKKSINWEPYQYEYMGFRAGNLSFDGS